MFVTCTISKTTEWEIVVLYKRMLLSVPNVSLLLSGVVTLKCEHEVPSPYCTSTDRRRRATHAGERRTTVQLPLRCKCPALYDDRDVMTSRQGRMANNFLLLPPLL